MDYLARREHSRHELFRKMADKGYQPDLVEDTLQQLADEGLLSDARFAESFVHARFQRGSGPLKIRAELRDKGVSDELASACLESLDEEWVSLARQVREKKYGSGRPADFRERGRQSRFLQQRGFSSGQIQQALGAED